MFDEGDLSGSFASRRGYRSVFFARQVRNGAGTVTEDRDIRSESHPGDRQKIYTAAPGFPVAGEFAIRPDSTPLQWPVSHPIRLPGGGRTMIGHKIGPTASLSFRQPGLHCEPVPGKRTEK